MKYTSIFSVLFLFICSFTFSQEPEYKKYGWETTPKLHSLSETERLLPEIVLKEVHHLEYLVKDENQVCYYLMHKIIKVNNDNAIEKNNRIYLPLSENAKLVVNKARVINSNGQVRELKEGDIKEGTNEETKATYRYFALEGVDKGSEIEYLTVIEQKPDYYGKIFVLQNENEKKDVEVEIVAPKHLVFKHKSYNGLPSLKDSTGTDGKNILFLKVDSIPGVKEEEFAVYRPHLMQLIFKLDENKNSGKKNLINYVEASQTIYDLTHEANDKTTTKNLQKIIREMKIGGIHDTKDKIRAIENYIKSNYFVSENAPYTNLPAILEYKNTTESGMAKLFAAIFDELKIEYQLVLTTDRFKLKFDPEFEAYSFLDTYLLYFPELKEYLCPGSFSHRLNCIPYGLTNNYGLFVKSVTLGDFKSGVGEIKFIEPSLYSLNRHDHNVYVDFKKSMDNPEISYSILFDGLYAQSIQPYYSYIPEDRQTEMNTSILKNILKDGTFSDITVENKGVENLAIKPLIIKAKCNASNLIEHAGDKYLFKIGELIGPQTELYQENERKFDIENEFNRSYTREITFEIPADYKVSNLDALKIDVSLLENKEASSAFQSNYELKGDGKITVKVQEFYKGIFYTKDKFQDFRKVVNAAADFNKIVLVIEKK